MTYYIMPKLGYTVEDLVAKGMNIHNTMIAKIKDGVIVETHLYTPSNVARYSAKFHPMFFKTKYLGEKGGRLVSLSGVVFSGYLADGWNPFKQLIYLTVNDRGAAYTDEIVNYIIKDRKLMRDNKKNYEYLYKLIAYMREQGFLNMTREGFLVIGSRKPPLGSNRIPIEDGYNPILYQIMRFIESSGRAKKSDIAKYMIEDLGWIEYDPILQKDAEQVLDLYLTYLLKEDYIKEETNGIFVVKKPLRSLSGGV